MGVAIAVTALVGLALGYVIATITRRDRRSPVESRTATTATDDGMPSSLREAVDHLEVGVVVVSSDKTVVFRNAAARAFHGTHIGVLVDDHLASTIAETASGDRATRLVELHGPPKTWLEISADPIPDGAAVATIRDVSERVRTDTMRTDFVTNISHELKTPVGAVAVLAEALIDEPDPEVVERLADRLVEEAHRAVGTIDDLLKLSQIESTRLADEIVDLTSVVQLAIGRGRAAAGDRGIEISPLDAPERLLIHGDERQLVSAVGNLVENAVKYSHDGGVVQVRTRADDTAVEVMVADHGIGIPHRDLDRIFERFYRVDKARSRETGGTGLGLSIVRHVATNHGGEVLVSSQEGEGATFVLRLPASLVVARDADQPTGETTPMSPTHETSERHE